jgi:hypothetical protein
LEPNLLDPNHSVGSDGDDAALFAAIRPCDDLDEIAFPYAL